MASANGDLGERWSGRAVVGGEGRRGGERTHYSDDFSYYRSCLTFDEARHGGLYRRYETQHSTHRVS